MIELADDLALDPSEAATQTFGVIAAKGGGKSYLATKFAEGLYDAGAPFVALDPVGNWSAITLGADGKSPGLSVVVIGGERADVPLVEEHADRLGTFLVLSCLQAVIDLSELSKTKRKAYVADLCEAMYRAARSERTPFMVIFEEAQVFAPQHAARGEERMLGAVTDIVRLGRNYGLGSMLVTQRPQSVSKEVLNQVECLLVGQLRGPQERKAIGGWITEQGVGITKEVLADLPALEPGQFCCWSPSWLRVFKKVRIRAKRTFDGSRTPKLGAARAASVKSQRDIADVVRLLGKLAEPTVAERAEARAANATPRGIAEALGSDAADELVELRAKVERLERENQQLEVLTAWNDAHRAQQELVRENVKALASIVQNLRDSSGRLALALDVVKDSLETALASSAAPPAASPVAPSPDRPRRLAGERPLRSTRITPEQLGVTPQKRRAEGGTTGLDKPGAAILGVLAREAGPVPKARLALLAGYSKDGGAFNNCLSRLRTAKWIEGSAELRITRTGQAVAPKVTPMPTGLALLEMWRTHPRMDTPMRAIFAALVDSVHPMTKEQLGKRTGYSATAGAFNNALSRLRTLGVVLGKGREPLRLAPALEAAAQEAA